MVAQQGGPIRGGGPIRRFQPCLIVFGGQRGNPKNLPAGLTGLGNSEGDAAFHDPRNPPLRSNYFNGTPRGLLNKSEIAGQNSSRSPAVIIPPTSQLEKKTLNAPWDPNMA